MTIAVIVGSPVVDEISKRDPDLVSVGGSRTWAVRGRNFVVAVTELEAGDRLTARGFPRQGLGAQRRRISGGPAVTGDSFPRLGAWVKLPAPESVELLAIAGFDFVVIDAEHGAIDTRTASTMIGLARGCGLAPFVRVAGTAPRDVHPGPIVLTNLLPTVVFRRIADASDSVRICAISHAEAHTSSIAALIASLRSIVGSLEIDDKLA